MFFIFSKLLVFLLKPINWFVGMPIWSMLTKNARRKRRILRGCFWLMLFFTNPFLGNRLFHYAEWDAVPMASLTDTFAIGIVLGGYTSSDFYTTDRVNLNFAVNRLTDAFQLYKKGHIRKILLSGGDGILLKEQVPEAREIQKLLLDFGIRPEDLIVEDSSRNTYENALLTKQVLEKQSLASDKLLLITSAFHMKRAMGCFKKVGLNVQPYPAHFIAKKPSLRPNDLFIPQAKVLHDWEFFLKEWMGLLMYKLKGYI
jgi:uncharacterized SAM-binding protein YcdF (DUF218 family)